jgi:hypothetical protein
MSADGTSPDNNTQEHSPLSQISYRPDPDLSSEIRKRETGADSPHDLARTAAKRYYAAVREEQPDLDEEEWHFWIDLLNGVWVNDPMSVRHLWVNVEDAEDYYFEKHGVDRDLMLKKSKSWSFAESLAVVDYAERWWAENA